MSNPPTRRMPQRTRSSFLTRTATDDASQLDRRLSVLPASPSPIEEQPIRDLIPHSDQSENPYEPLRNNSKPVPYRHELTKKVLGIRENNHTSPTLKRRSSSGRRRSGQGHPPLGDSSLTAQMHAHPESKGENVHIGGQKPGSLPRPVGGQDKLGTFSGVFVPTSLNVLSIIMFLRFGFILGQSGVLGMLGMLVASYLINLVTTLSISAIASNGTVRGGGAYYLISRSLGPEFGGSIGIVFYLGFVFNTGMNAVGLIDCLKQNFGQQSGNWAQWLPEGFWWQYLWATVVLVICTAICLAGSGIFARCSNGLLAILLVATFSIPFSALIMKPFESRKLGIEYTGLSRETFMGNLLPRLTKGADGSQIDGKENFQDLFGILFPATGGIFAGASMSGDLKHPSRAIPKGTLWGLVLTFFAYTVVILAMAATITRPSFYRNVNVIQDVNISGILVLLGEFATSFFSSLMGVIGSAKLLQALARDNLLPGFSIFGQGTKGSDEPVYAILITHVVAQLTMLCDLNQIASFVTMTYLMTFLVTNLACFLLKVSSAPNFRPSFHYFNWWIAAAGTLISGATMFFVDGLYATGCVGILVVIFLIIHYTSPPKSWGDVSQSLIYHQVRKYLLRLRQEHVKFWRPQILLFVNDPRRGYKLIQFCNSLKKGALFVLGHVIVAQDFGGAVPEARRQQAAWTKYIDFSKVKAFVNIAISPGFEWGTRNIVLSAGLGGMRPNIVVLGFYNLNEYRRDQPLIDVPSPQQSRPSSQAGECTKGKKHDRKIPRRDSKEAKAQGLLPTDSCKMEGAMSVSCYVTILEDLLLRLQINVAVAKGFQDLEFPHPKEDNTKKYIDLWPIQMSAEIAAEGGEQQQNVLTTNFDTYTLILQLGCILNTVPAWKKVYKLRVAVFVEYETDVAEERGRVETLLANLRIEGEVKVFWLASGELRTYELIVNGTLINETERDVDSVLKEEEWWQEIQKIRGRRGELSASEELANVEELLSTAPNWPSSSFQHGRREDKSERFEGIKKMFRRRKRSHTMSGLNKLGVSLGMRTHRLDPDVVSQHASHASASEDSGSSEDSDSDNLGDAGDDDDISSEGRASAASENDIDDFEENSQVDHLPSRSASPSKIMRRFSHGDSMRGPPPSMRANLRHNTHQSSAISELHAVQLGANPAAGASETALVGNSKTSEQRLNTASTVEIQPLQTSVPQSRPKPMRRPSGAKFSSKPVPKTTVAAQDGPGPSIMFTDEPDTPKERHQSKHSIYNKHGAASPNLWSKSPEQASGYPSSQAVPLNFNDLPCRAQHLILNELMQQQSRDTAVIFTTLPSPVEGTCLSEADSVGYVSDLEVLCQDLPPTLLVHSNSMTVTMSL
ncbi:MAG: hypothetical protein M1827_000713 [Pycnora praestabilis]|nr:MAG: hypothetical protein M1827_000713 [Pycnora praestabilis]